MVVPQAGHPQAASMAMGWESHSCQGWDRAVSLSAGTDAPCSAHHSGGHCGRNQNWQNIPYGGFQASSHHLIAFPTKPPQHPCPYTIPSTAFPFSFPGLGENHGTKDKTLTPGHSSEKALQHLAVETPLFLHLTPSEHCIGIEPFILTTQTQIWPVLSPCLYKEGN